MVSAFPGIAPLTLALSPEGRGYAGGTAGEGHHRPENTEPFATPLRGEAAAQRRVRGAKLQPAQVKRARALRSDMTDAENHLWYHLRDRRLAGFKFVRQLPIAGYYADFACREAMLVIEADGGQHDANHDVIRDRAIEAAGYTVLRFWNNDILSNISGVLETILQSLQSLQSLDSRVPSPLRGEGQGEGPSPIPSVSE